MDLESYESLFNRISDTLIYSNDTQKQAFLASDFSTALEECYNCVSKGLELAIKLLEETNIQVQRLCDYIEKAVILLQMLSDFIKNMLESAAMACCNLKPFPTVIGNIILTVFMHCKDSAWIYGSHIKCVEVQLKDLFRTCHELQLTYLMTLEKHFIFDLSEKEEQDILIEALNINMRIGEIVQALDIKTMAEQWKAYTVICEKYSNFLADNNIYNKCSHLFATIIKDNIKVAMESTQDNKSIIRSLKVANFTIKILARMSNMFKHSITNNYEHVVELMEYIYLHNPAYLEGFGEKSEQFINMMRTNVLNATDALCNILLQDERFLECVHKTDVSKLEPNPLLGYTILVTTLSAAAARSAVDRPPHVNQKLIHCIYRILPKGHYWFNIGLKFPTSDGSIFSLYEHLLSHTAALATTFTSQQYMVLEQTMYEAILGTDCYSALFSANLWVLLMRISNETLASNTLSSLLRLYQRLEDHRLFHNSPQRVHLGYTIQKMFELLPDEDRRRVCKKYLPQDCVWSVLRVSNSPHTARRSVEGGVLEHFKTCYNRLRESSDVTGKHIEELIKIMRIAATCSFVETSPQVIQYVVELWLKLCQRNEYIRADQFGTSDTLWLYRYMEALTSLTDCVRIKLNSASSGKILHCMSTLLHNCNAEITVLLFGLFCKMAANRFEDDNQHVIDDIFKDVLKKLQLNEDLFIKQYILNTLSKYEHEEFASTLLCENQSLRKALDGHLRRNLGSDEWKQDLQAVANNEYIHKCVRITSVCKDGSDPTICGVKSNFDLGDFTFDDECEEPSRKKAKLDSNETESLVERLEAATMLLCQGHSALHSYRTRISDVIDKLRNIVN